MEEAHEHTLSEPLLTSNITMDRNTPSWVNPNNNTKSSSGSNTANENSSKRSTDTATDSGNSTRNVATANPSRGEYWSCGAIVKRDARLLLITLAIIVCINIPLVRFAVYPFSIFSTYIHEICHGMASIFVGGSIQKIYIYADTSGLCYTYAPSSGRKFISSAGYQGTATVGCLLLLLRRTRHGARGGMVLLTLFILLSVVLWIRNVFGIVAMTAIALLLALAVWKLPPARLRDLFVAIAVTATLNAITDVGALFGSTFVVNGQESSTDAHTMADLTGVPRLVWAFLWLVLALVLAAVGLVFAVPGADESAYFKCCGLCQKWGCFSLCNYKFGKEDKERKEEVVVAEPILVV